MITDTQLTVRQKLHPKELWQLDKTWQTKVQGLEASTTMILWAWGGGTYIIIDILQVADIVRLQLQF